MSGLVDSSQQAPLATAEKSLDKLEIELEEKQELSKKVEMKEVNGGGSGGIEEKDDDNKDKKSGCGGSQTKAKSSKGQPAATPASAGDEGESHLRNGKDGNTETEDGETPKPSSKATGRRPVFNIKISKILRKSFTEKSSSDNKKEKVPEKKQEAAEVGEDDDDGEEAAKKKLLPPTTSTTTQVQANGESKEKCSPALEVAVELKTNEEESNGGGSSNNQENGADTNVGSNKPAPLDTSTCTSSTTHNSSFITTFSTPKWINFRRVFNFNRDSPSSLMMMTKNGKSENVEPVSLIFDIPEDGIRKEVEKPEKACEAEVVEDSETSGNKSESVVRTAAASVEKNFITPLIQLFQKKTRTPKSAQEKDVEAGEVGTELLATSHKASSDGNGLTGTTSKCTPANKSEEQTDGEALPKHEHKLLDEFADVEKKAESNGQHEKTRTTRLMEIFSSYAGGRTKTTTGAEADSATVKPTSELWRQRIQERLPKHSKWMFTGLVALLILVIIAVTIAALRVNKRIDIGTLIIGGKYINTITSCGKIQGISEDGGFVFRGIPYALPPVGELRWRPAKIHQNLHHCWNGTYLAHNHTTPCWQFYRDGSYDGKEDCLYLDLYTPKVYYDTPLPVVVFIGGESLNGGQSSILKPSVALARTQNVVFITVSIRKSVLGFLTADPLTSSSYPMSSGNYGLSDLLAALQWVKYNVEHFGGDPDHVTILGHQSGATLVTALMSSHLAKGLFQQVWVSGGSPVSTLISFQEAEIQNAKYLEESYLNCTELTCMQNRGPEQLLQHVPYDWRAFHQDLPTKGEVKHHWLVRDGVILREPLHQNSLFPAQQEYPSDKIPFVSGAPAEVDASPEMFSYLNWNDTSKFSAYLESKLGSFGASLSREVIDRYTRPEATPWQQFVSLLSDVRTICPLYYNTLSRADESMKSPVYFYVATQRKHTPIGYVADANADIAAILGVYQPETREEKKFVQNMEKLFYDFVKKGKFPDEQDVRKSIYIVDENIQKIYTYPNCEFWQEHSFYPNYSRVD